MFTIFPLRAETMSPQPTPQYGHMDVLSFVPFNLSGNVLQPVRKEVPPKKAPAAVAPDSLRKFLLVTGMNILLDKFYIYKLSVCVITELFMNKKLCSPNIWKTN
jgi:hypothetical protein